MFLDPEKEDRETARFCYNYFHTLRREQDYQQCDDILATVDVERLGPITLIALLTMTAPLKLNNRKEFYDRVYSQFEKNGKQYADRALIGLK